MARIRVNRNSFSGGVFSKKAQANSNAEIYNYGLDICRNMIIDPLGGAYKRQGTRHVTDLESDRCRLIEFLYAPGKSCIVLFTESGISFFKYNDEAFDTTSIEYEENDKLLYEDFSEMSYFQFENKLYFYIAKRENGPTYGFWSIELNAESEFSFSVFKGYKMAPGPKAPYSPSRLLEITPVEGGLSFQTLTEDGLIDKNIFTQEDIGRKITFKYLKSAAEDKADIYWPEVMIEEVSEGKVSKAELTPGSVKEIPNEKLTVREWFISAFDGGEESGGRLGSPNTMTMFQGRLYLGKDTYVFASKRSVWPLCFSMGPNEDDGFVERITSGNMGQILWMYPIEKMIIGTADGIYLIGNTAQYAEAITNYNFVATKIGSMGCNALRPVDAEGDLIFVGTDNKSIYELSLTQDGGYVISRINRLSEELMRSSVIDHAWQQYPRKIYWTVMNDGALLGCTYDKEGAIRAWHEHTIGGKNTFVLQCETTREKDIDILWLIVRREIGGELIVSLEVLSPPFDPVENEVFEQEYTDSGIRFQNKHTIKDIENAESYFVDIKYSIDEVGYLATYIDLKLGNLLIAFLDNNDIVSKLYDNPELKYYSLSSKGFFVAGYDGNYTISAEHDDQMKNAYFLFPCSILIKSIKNIASISHNSLVYVEVNLPGIFSQIEDIVLTIKNSGFKELDGKVFTTYQPGATGFYLADVNTGIPISLHLDGELSEKAIIYVGKKEKPDHIQSRNPKIIFDHNIFQESIEAAGFHTGRCIRIKGATKYNGEDFNFKLIETDTENKKYTYGLYYVNPEDDINFVAYTYGYGVYDRLLKDNGSVYFYFDNINKKDIEHLIGQNIVYTINGNWTYNKTFTLTEDDFQDEKFKLEKAAISVDIGLPYVCELKPVPLSGGSLFGSSEGCVGTQKTIVLMMYASLGGQYGPSEPDEVDGTNKLLDIPYPWDDSVDEEKQLVTAAIKVPIWGNKDLTIRTVYLRSAEPLSFNVLSIVQDVNVSDG